MWNGRFVFVALLPLLGLSVTSMLHANLNGPPPGYTGAPGEGTCSEVGCHEIPSGDIGAVYIRVSGPQHTDTVGFRVNLGGPSHVDHWGFQLTILDSLDQPFGEMLVLDSVRTKLTPGAGGRTYLSHTAAGVPAGSNYTSWNLLWVRPAGAVITDPIRFYVSGLLADGDGTPASDAVVTVLEVGPFCIVEPPPGDVDLSGLVTSADVIFMVGHIFKGGRMPDPCQAAGDANCDGDVTSADIIVIVNYVFKSGVPPCDVCPLIIDGTWACP